LKHLRQRPRRPRTDCPGSPTCPGDQVAGSVSTSPGVRSVRWRTRRSGWR
jgi:hypothetical protein